MTADATSTKKSNNAGTLMPSLAVVFAGLTLLFALFSMVLGSRMATVSRNQMEAQNEIKASESVTIENTKAALQDAQKQIDAEKIGSEKLRKQLSAAMQEVKKLKADLAKASQTIENLKSNASAAPPVKTVMPQPAASTQPPGGDGTPIEQNAATKQSGDIEPQPQPIPAAMPARQGSQLEESYIRPGSPSTSSQPPSSTNQPASPEKSEVSQPPPPQPAPTNETAE